MDTSKEYIKMCVKAEEIQAPWKPALGDFHCCPCTACVNREADIYVIERAELDILNKRDFTNTCSVYTEYAREYGGHFVDHFYEAREVITWLPRQDQLQVMVKPFKNNSTHAVLRRFQYWYEEETERFRMKGRVVGDNYHSSGQSKFDMTYCSMEITWFAFVMKEKFNKTWDGKGWVA